MKKAVADRKKANENGNLALRIASLSPRRQQIIRPVLANPRPYVLLSVRDMAESLETDAATVVRIVRGMGFENYRSFQHHLHEVSIAYATSLDTMQNSPARKNGAAAVIRESIEQDLKNVGALRSSMDPAAVEDLARKLYAARRVLVIGGDAATSLVLFLEYNLMLLGLPALAATGHGRIFHLSRTTNRSDIVIGISFRRGLRMTVEGLERARANGAYCVGIADSLLSPIISLADSSFIASVETPSFGVSYVAPMAFMNALVAACASLQRSRTLALLHDVDEEQRHGSRWYTDNSMR